MPEEKIQPHKWYMRCTGCSQLFASIEAVGHHYLYELHAEIGSWEVIIFEPEEITNPAERVLS